MSQAMPAPQRQRTSWWLVALPLLAVAIVLGLLYQLRGLHEPGKRTRLVFPGDGSFIGYSCDGIDLQLRPELRDLNLQAELGQKRDSVDQTSVFRRESSRQFIFITPTKPGLKSSDIRYSLLDGDGAEISSGLLWPDMTLPPNEKTELVIGDFELLRAARIVLSKAQP